MPNINKYLHVRGELTEELKLRVLEHKQRFIKLFHGRYTEMLPSLIIYENTEKTAIDFLKVEVALRKGYHVVIGETVSGNIVMMGYVKNVLSSENPTDLLTQKPLMKDDIHFIIPNKEIPTEMEEISFIDNCTTGNFIVLKNKTMNIVDDYEVITHYTLELAEIVLSRYSIAMQSKIHTFFTSEANDETINQLVAELYNGVPYLKVTGLFDPRDNMHTIENNNLAQSFQELKREYQNKISELNNMLGINSLAVEKSSGVSDTEAKSNRAYVASISNIYLTAREKPLEKLNRRYKLNIEPIYNDDVTSELQIEEGETDDRTMESNDNDDEFRREKN